jgi:dethiobiotin synthetase
MSPVCCNSVDYRKRLNRGNPSTAAIVSAATAPGGVCAENNGSAGGLWWNNLSVTNLHDLRSCSGRPPEMSTELPTVGLVFLCGEWQADMCRCSELSAILERWVRQGVDGLECQLFCGHIGLSEDMVDDFADAPPRDLPALVAVSQKAHATTAVLHHVPIKPAVLLQALAAAEGSDAEKLVLQKLGAAVAQIEIDLQLTVPHTEAEGAVRIFVAGDRSSVGKSSVCLGILGSLLAMGYSAEKLAYIKPATQSESTQLIQTYCESHGIHCVPIGPLVYYRGFTRAFLAGETASTDDLLAGCGAAVDRISRGKQIVLMDGVGFPAVGSICGTDNAAVCLACSYPLANGTRKPASVVLVGGSGVGGAVDAFNLNASYFERNHIPVVGAIFNKLSTEDGFYSLENCRAQVTSYFAQNERQQRLERQPFGFLPKFDKLSKPSLPVAEEWIRLFGQYVDVATILSAAERVKGSNNLEGVKARPLKRIKVERPEIVNRSAIERAAIQQGAPQSA